MVRRGQGRGPGVVRRRRPDVMPAVVVGLIVVAGASLDRVYNGHLLVQLVAGAGFGSVLLSVALRRAPAWVVAPLSIVAMVAVSLAAVGVSARSGGVSGGLVSLTLDAARNAVPRLLTALIPVEPQPDTVLAPVVLAWLAGFAGAELAARARRPGLAALPPTLLYTGALVLVGPNAAVLYWQPLLFAALVAVGFALGPPGRDILPGGPRPRLGLRIRTAVGLAVGLVAVLAAAAVTAPVVASQVGGRPADPRVLVAPPNLDVEDENPLIRISGWAANPRQHLFDVAILRRDPGAATLGSPNPDGGSAAAYDTRLRLAVLPDFDGVTWHSDADYRGAGRVLPPPVNPPGVGSPADPATAPAGPPVVIEERITVDQLVGRLMPAVSIPQRVEGERVAYDQTSTTLLHESPLSRGVTYTVTSASPSIDVTLLPAADVPSGSSVAGLLAVGDAVPPDLSRLAAQVAVGQGSPYLRAVALEAFLAEHFRFAADAPSGHAYPNLRFFLFDDPRAGGQRGTSEQFATAFATLGRLMGLPTRVVVGFQTPVGGGPITGADARAWPEVLFSGVGWVAFDPLPKGDAPPRPLEDQFLPKPPPPTTPPATIEPPTESPTVRPSTAAAVAAPRPAGPPLVALVGGASGGLVVVLLLVGLMLALLRRAVRARRLDEGGPPQRVLGAWGEVLDTLELAGRPAPAHLPAADVAAYAAAVGAAQPGRLHTRHPRPAVPPIDELAARVNAVGFAPPGARSALDDLAAHSAKVQALAYARAVRARRSWWRRLLWSIDPRPLRRRRERRGPGPAR